MHKINANNVIYKFEAGLKPIATIKDGDSISINANDCFFQQVLSNDDLVSEIDFGKVNPATGPIYVEGAEIGDVLKVEVLDIRVGDSGSIVVLPGGGMLGDQVTQPLTRIVPIKDGFVDFLGLKQKIDPMIGVIGVSPGKDQEGVVTGTPGNHGGNMDTTDVRKGATLYFPVREAGALLALGDCHAIMGDGELCISGLEIVADVDLRISVIKNVEINWPLLENEHDFMIITSKETLEEAVYEAGSEMTKYVQKAHGILWEEAYMFSSLFVDYKISQVVNPMKTIRAVVSKDLLNFNNLFNQ